VLGDREPFPDPKLANLTTMLRACARLDSSRDSSGSDHDGAGSPSARSSSSQRRMARAIVSNGPPSMSSIVHVRSNVGNTSVFVSTLSVLTSLISRATSWPRQHDDQWNGRIEVVPQHQRGLQRLFVAVWCDVAAGQRWCALVGVRCCDSVDVAQRCTGADEPANVLEGRVLVEK
jgi:hypothetical protein